MERDSVRFQLVETVLSAVRITDSVRFVLESGFYSWEPREDAHHRRLFGTSTDEWRSIWSTTALQLKRLRIPTKGDSLAESSRRASVHGKHMPYGSTCSSFRLTMCARSTIHRFPGCANWFLKPNARRRENCMCVLTPKLSNALDKLGLLSSGKTVCDPGECHCEYMRV